MVAAARTGNSGQVRTDGPADGAAGAPEGVPLLPGASEQGMGLEDDLQDLLAKLRRGQAGEQRLLLLPLQDALQAPRDVLQGFGGKAFEGFRADEVAQPTSLIARSFRQPQGGREGISAVAVHLYIMLYN